MMGKYRDRLKVGIYTESQSRLRELALRGQREPGGGIRAT